MRISRKYSFLAVALTSFLVPIYTYGDVIGVVQEGQQLTVSGFTITNTNAFAVTLTGLAASVVKANFAGDETDFVTAVTFAGGTCVPLLGVANGLAANAACTVNLTFSTPGQDVGEPVDFGVSQITLDRIFNNGPVTSLIFEIQVNDAPAVPEPDPIMLMGLGIVVLLGASFIAKRRKLPSRNESLGKG